MRKILLITLAAALCAGCSSKSDGFEKAEMSSDSPRMEMRGTEIFCYEPLTCQLGFNREKCEFRMHNDTMADYVVATLSEIPAQKGQKLTADLEWTTERDTKTKSGAAFVVKKSEDNVFWLWDKTDRITLVLKILD